MLIANNLIVPKGDGVLTRNPLQNRLHTSFFVTRDDIVKKHTKKLDSQVFLNAGPSEYIKFGSKDTNVAIVNTGGLCPGINNILYELVDTLENTYMIENIRGIHNGFKGFYTDDTIELSTSLMEGIHKKGGSFIGTSRYVLDVDMIDKYLKEHKISQLYIIGGDGTHNAAYMLSKHVDASIACLPKTIDNDIPVIDRSFGYETAVQKATEVIETAVYEAKSSDNTVSIVKLMGKYCGKIALNASLASYGVDICLIPEVPADLKKVVNYIHKVMAKQNNCVIVIAEGVSMKTHQDISFYLKNLLTSTKYHVKYFDPSYIIRGVPANTNDAIYCKLLAQSAVHGCMAGYSGFSVGAINNNIAYIDLKDIVNTEIKIKPELWRALVQCTKQPEF